MSRLDFGVAIVVVGCAAVPPPAAASHEASGASASVPVQNTAAVPDASTPAATPSSGASAPSNPDQETCHGLIDEALQHQLAGRAAEVRFCYEHLLEREPQREGRLMVTVKLSGTGNIDRAWITVDDLNDAETSKCTLAAFKEPLNGRVTSDCALVNVPLRFQIKKAQPPPEPL